MKILHSYCLNYNLGDYALGIGVKNLFRKYFKVDLIAETNLQGQIFNEYYINEVINKKYDLLIIGGGGIIHGAHWPNGWFWLIEKDLIKQIKIPFIIYGVGVNYWIEEGKIPERTVLHLKETMKYAKSFSVRNDGSHLRLLEQTGINAGIVPDPGFHVDLNYKRFRNFDQKFILIQLADDKSEMRFGSFQKRNIFITKLKKLVRKYSQVYRIIMIPHVFEDIQISKEVVNGIENTEVWDFNYFSFDHIYEIFDYYKDAELVIAMRGHGQIVPISFETPVISLNNHPKHKGLMENLGLKEYSIDIDEEDFIDILFDKVEFILNNKSIFESKMKSIKASLNNQSKLFLKNLQIGK